nr:hypothetical protein [Tanacetum cinerariifolium]
MDQQNPTLAKIPILDTVKFEQWQFRIQKYLQHEHYALWEVIKFRDSYEALGDVATTGSASDGTGNKKGRTVTLTTDDMQKRKNDVKARTLYCCLFLMSTNYNSVYESEVQKKSEPNSQNMAFISSAKHSSGNEEVNIASGSTASINVSTASANIGVASISQDTACAYIASQSSSSQVLEEDREEDKHPRNNVAGFDKSKDRGRRDNFRQGSKVEEHALNTLMAIDGVGWDWSYMTNDDGNQALVADEEAPSEFALMAKTNAESEDLELLKKEKCKLETKLTGFQTASKDLDSLLESQRLDKNKEGLGYSAVPPPPAQVYSPPKKDMSWTGLPEFKDDTITNYSRPSPAIESTSDDAQNRNPSVTETEASPSTISPKPFIKFVKENDSPTKSKVDKAETARKPPVNQGGCKITDKGTIKTGKLEFENVYFVKYLKYNLFSMSQICDSKNSVLFTDSECIVLGRNFKLLDDTNVLLMTPRQHNMYSIDLNNIVPHKDLTCLVAQASADECMIWHRRLGFLKPFGCHVMILNTLDHLGKFKAKGDEGYFIGYSMSSKAFRVFNKRTKRVEENLHVELLENKAIEKGAGPNWLFDIDSLTKSMNYVPVDAGINSTNLSGTKDAASQELKKDVSSLRYIALPKWVHDALLESSLSKPQDDCSTDVPESSGNTNLTATSTNPSTYQMKTLIVETPIPTVSSPVPTACFIDSQEPSSDTRLISKRVANQVETLSLDNILTLTNRFEDILGVTKNSDESNRVEADVSNMETTIIASPTPTLRIHKDHPKSQIIGPVDTPIQTRNKSKEEEEIDYDEVFAPVARIEAIGLFLAYALFMGFTVYQMDVKSAFLYDTINEEVGTIDQTLFIKRKRGNFILVQVYVDDIIFGSSNPQLCREFEALMHEKFQMSAIDVRSANTPMDKENPWGKDGTGKDVDLHLYRSMIGSLMYLTASRSDIMFAGHPKLGLGYPKESPFDLVAYSDSDYGGATQDHKSTTRGCQFLGKRLISLQCKKQTIMATLTTEAEYVAAASCSGQVLWIQNQLLDYGLRMPCEALSKEISSSILH